MTLSSEKRGPQTSLTRRGWRGRRETGSVVTRARGQHVSETEGPRGHWVGACGCSAAFVFSPQLHVLRLRLPWHPAKAPGVPGRPPKAGGRCGAISTPTAGRGPQETPDPELRIEMDMEVAAPGGVSRPQGRRAAVGQTWPGCHPTCSEVRARVLLVWHRPRGPTADSAGTSLLQAHLWFQGQG